MALSEAKANGEPNLDDKVKPKVTKGKHGGARPNTGGRRPGAGRKKGVPNKVTADVKKAILEAFEEAGGAQYLKKVALENPQVFCTLIGKVLPMQVTGEGGGSIKVTWTDE